MARRASPCPSRRCSSPGPGRSGRTGSCRSCSRCAAPTRVARPRGIVAASRSPTSAIRGIRPVSTRSQRLRHPPTWRSTKPSGRPRSPRPIAAASSRCRSASASTTAKPMRRAASSCIAICGGTWSHTTTPRRYSTTRKSEPTTSWSSQNAYARGDAIEVPRQRVDGAELAAHVVRPRGEASERWAAHDHLGARRCARGR